MIRKVPLIFLTMILAVMALLLAAKNPTGPNTVSFDEPGVMWLTIGILVVLFLPPIILSFFNHLAANIISAIYQTFIVLSFLGLVLVGLLIPSTAIIMIGVLGSLTSIGSIIVTIMPGRNSGLVTN